MYYIVECKIYINYYIKLGVIGQNVWRVIFMNIFVFLGGIFYIFQMENIILGKYEQMIVIYSYFNIYIWISSFKVME